MKVKSIEIAGMNNVTAKVYKFDDFNYLHGPNGAGKSTIMEAINLALLGYIPGEDKKPMAVLKHSPMNNLRVKLTFDDNSFIQRTFVKHGAGAQQIVEKSPEDLDIDSIIADVQLPVFNFNDFMSLSANMMKEWFLKFLPSQAIAIDWHTEIHDALENKDVEQMSDSDVNQIISIIKSYNESGLKEVQAANTFFKDNLSGMKKELDRAQKTLQNVSLMSTDSSDSKDDLTAKIQSWTALKDTQTRDKQIRANNDRIASMISTFIQRGITADSYENDSTYIAFQNKLAEQIDLRNQLVQKKAELNQKYTLTELQKSATSKHDEMLKLSARIEVLSQFVGQTSCPVLKRTCNDLLNYSDQCSKDIEDLKSKLALAGTEFDNLQKQYTDAAKEIMDNDTSLHKVEQDIQNTKSQMENLKNQYSQKSQYESMMTTPVSTEPDTADYDSLINDAQKSLQEIAQQEASMKFYEDTMKDVADFQKKVEQYKVLVDLTSTSGLQAKLASQADPFDSLKDSMNSLMSTWTSKFDTVYFNNEQKKNTFEFGIKINGVKIPYTLMSSGEECLFSLALFISLVRISDTSLKLVMVDDAFDHLDDMTFSNLIGSLYTPGEKKDYQLIVAGVKGVNGQFVKEIPSDSLVD